MAVDYIFDCASSNESNFINGSALPNVTIFKCVTFSVPVRYPRSGICQSSENFGD